MHQIVNLWQSDSCLRGKDVQSPLGFLRPQSTPEHFNPSPLWLHTLVHILGSDSGWSAQQWCKRAWLQLHSGFCLVKKTSFPPDSGKNAKLQVRKWIHTGSYTSLRCRKPVAAHGRYSGRPRGAAREKKVSFCNLYICWIWVNSTGA